MYGSLGKAPSTQQQCVVKMVSAEVPITIQDFAASPHDYDRLLSTLYQNGEVTEDDVLSSGYTKVVQQIKCDWSPCTKIQIPKPEDRNVVAVKMEDFISTTVKPTWQSVAPAVQAVEAIAPCGIG